MATDGRRCNEIMLAIKPYAEKYASMPPASSVHSVTIGNAGGTPAFTQSAIRQLALQAGFTEAGIAALPHPDTLRDAQRFEHFVDSGHAGSMEYLARRNEEGQLVRSNVQLPFPWARSVVVCLASYYADAPLSIAPAPANTGWIARYAWSSRRDERGRVRPSDYHKVLLKRLRALEAGMHESFGDFESRAYVDTGPVVERNVARVAGLGWTGKNTCLIHPTHGSWNFLAVIVTSLELAPKETAFAVPDRCGSCRRCLDACPTNALIEPYRMDATRCISYLTIEHRGEIADHLKEGMGRQIYGCDICQDVCPWNGKLTRTLALEQNAAQGQTANVAGQGSGNDLESRDPKPSDLAPRPELINPTLEWLASLDFAAWEELVNGSPMRRAGFDGLRRNLAIAMGNSRLGRYRARLQEWAAANAPADAAETPLQSAARWALRRITEE
jgi:epoxyqueuosine reductase